MGWCGGRGLLLFFLCAVSVRWVLGFVNDDEGEVPGCCCVEGVGFLVTEGGGGSVSVGWCSVEEVLIVEVIVFIPKLSFRNNATDGGGGGIGEDDERERAAVVDPVADAPAATPYRSLLLLLLLLPLSSSSLVLLLLLLFLALTFLINLEIDMMTNVEGSKDTT